VDLLPLIVMGYFYVAIKMIFFDNYVALGRVSSTGLCRIEVADPGSNDHAIFKVPPFT
jgi:hypothetical protein